MNHTPSRVRAVAGVLALVVAPACAGDDGPAGSSETTGAVTSSGSDADGSSSGGADTSTSGDSSTGEPTPPAMGPCEVASIAQGIVGRTDRRSCDEGGGECVAPESGVVVWLFDDNPQIGGGDFDPGMLDPAVPMLEETVSGTGGLFEFSLGAGGYFVCTPEGADTVLCSAEVIIVGADPLHVAVYETGNGSSWSTDSCAS